MSEQPKRKFGWRRDLPDFRDFTVSHNELSSKVKAIGNQHSILALLKKTGAGKLNAKKLPATVDLRKWCSPIEQQGNIGSYTQAESSGKIPYPAMGEKIAGGHAIMAVGYDDKLKIKNTNLKGPETTGALLIRNSWGTEWGEKGYGWLPYAYVLEGLADEFWSLIKSEWIESGEFSL